MKKYKVTSDDRKMEAVGEVDLIEELYNKIINKIDLEGNIKTIMSQPIRRDIDCYGGGRRRPLIIETLPQGALPIYDQFHKGIWTDDWTEDIKNIVEKENITGIICGEEK